MSEDAEWSDLIVGARMTVDREFRDRVSQSEFTSQEWGLVMTAVEFEIEAPDDPQRARLVGNTEKLPAVLPEMERVAEMNPMDPDAGSRGGGSDGLLDSLLGSLGLSGDDESDEERIEAAETLVDEYARQLQTQLEQTGQWEHVLAVAGTDADADTDLGPDAGPDHD